MPAVRARRDLQPWPSITAAWTKAICGGLAADTKEEPPTNKKGAAEATHCCFDVIAPISEAISARREVPPQTGERAKKTRHLRLGPRFADAWLVY